MIRVCLCAGDLLPQKGEQMANQMKVIVEREGVIKFSGVPWLEFPTDAVFDLPPLEYTAQGVVVLAQRQTARLAGVTSTYSGEPVEVAITVRMVRPPQSQSESDLVSAAAAKSENNRLTKAAREENQRASIIAAIQDTAIRIANAKPDTLTDRLADRVLNSLDRALPPGHHSGQ